MKINEVKRDLPKWVKDKKFSRSISPTTLAEENFENALKDLFNAFEKSKNKKEFLQKLESYCFKIQEFINATK